MIVVSFPIRYNIPGTLPGPPTPLAAPDGAIPRPDSVPNVAASMMYHCRVVALQSDMYIVHQKGWIGLHYVQKSNYGAILSILAAPRPFKDVPHRPNTLFVVFDLSGPPLGPPGVMI